MQLTAPRVDPQGARERRQSAVSADEMPHPHGLLPALHVGDAATANGYYAGAENGSMVPHCCWSAKTKTLGHNIVAKYGQFGRLGLRLFRSMA